jgi:hypothetical protein
VLDPHVSNIDGFVPKIMSFLHSFERSYFTQSLCSSQLKTLRSRQHSFQNVTQFLQRKKVLDPLVSNIDGLLTRDTVFVPFT